MTIKTLLTGALLSLPIAAQAAPVPIFASLDGYGLVDVPFEDGLPLDEFGPFRPGLHPVPRPGDSQAATSSPSSPTRRTSRPC